MLQSAYGPLSFVHCLVSTRRSHWHIFCLDVSVGSRTWWRHFFLPGFLFSLQAGVLWTHGWYCGSSQCCSANQAHPEGAQPEQQHAGRYSCKAAVPGAGGGKLQLRVTTVRKSWSPLAENNPAAIPTMHKRRKNSCQECLKFRPAFCWLKFPELWKLKAHLFFLNYHVILSSLPCLLVWREHVPQVKFAITRSGCSSVSASERATAFRGSSSYPWVTSWLSIFIQIQIFFKKEMLNLSSCWYSPWKGGFKVEAQLF